MDLATQVEAIPAGLGVAGAYLAKDDGAGKPSLETLLGQIRAAIVALKSTTATQGLSMIGITDAAARITATNGEAALAEIAARLLNPAASEAAIKAIPAAARADGTMIVELGTSKLWVFDADSAAGGSAWVLVPDVGTGRWLRSDLSAADLAAVTGAALIGSNAAGYIAATVAGQLTEVKAIADAGMPVQKRSLHLTQADLTDAVNGEAQAINIGAVLPANARIVGADIKLTTPFTGGGVASVACDIGTAGDIDAIVDGADMLAAAVDGQSSTRPNGIAPNKHFVAAGAQLIATFTPDVAKPLVDLTAGEATIDVLFVVLP